MKAYRWLKNPLVVVFTPLMLALLFAVACGSAATAVPQAAATAVPAAAAAVATPVPAAVAATPKPAAVAATPVPVAKPAATVAPAAVALATVGGHLPMHVYAFPTPFWHPHVTNTQHVMVASGLHNQLIEYNAETEDRFDLRGDLAKSWDATEGGKSYIFRLNEKARWHDGKPVTAEDVVHSFNSMVDPDAKPARVVPRPALNLYYERGTARAIDARTVELPLKFPYAPDFIPTVALDFVKIVAKHWDESGIDVQKWENQMGSGPFKPGKLVKDVSIELVKNRDYWKEGLPRIDSMTQFFIPDKGTAIAAYKTERVLMANWGVTQLSNQETARLQEEEKGRLRVEFIPNASFFFFFMNNSKPPFDNPKVRQAVNLALHRQPFFETFGVGGIGAMAPPMGQGTWFGRTAQEIVQLPGWRELNGAKHPDDIARARKLMAEAGFPDGFKADMLVRNVVEFPDQAPIYKEQLKKALNIDLTIGLVDSATGFQRYTQGDWVVAAQGSAHFVIQPDAIFGRTYAKAGTWPTYARSVLPQWWQEAYTQQASEPDQGKRKATLRKMEDYLINEDPGCCAMIYWNARDWIMNHRIKGVHASGTLWAGFKHETTYCDPKC